MASQGEESRVYLSWSIFQMTELTNAGSSNGTLAFCWCFRSEHHLLSCLLWLEPLPLDGQIWEEFSRSPKTGRLDWVQLGKWHHVISGLSRYDKLGCWKWSCMHTCCLSCTPKMFLVSYFCWKPGSYLSIEQHHICCLFVAPKQIWLMTEVSLCSQLVTFLLWPHISHFQSSSVLTYTYSSSNAATSVLYDHTHSTLFASSHA